MQAYLGSQTPLPNLNFSSQNYYLGIRIGTDSEMVPRKKIGAVSLAIDSESLQGAVLGTQSGNIPQIGISGKLSAGIIPNLTQLGTVTAGTWNGSVIQNGYVASNLTGKTYNGLSLTTNSDGFSIAGGTTSRTLTVSGGDVTLNQDLSMTSSPTFAGLNLTGLSGLLSADSNGKISSYAGALGVANGGTGASTIGSAGSIAYSAGSVYAFSAAGTSGQVLLSGGTGAPIWGTVSGGIIAPNSLDFSEFKNNMTLDSDLTVSSSPSNYSINFDSGTLYIDAANNRVGIGTSSPGQALDVSGNGNFSGTLTANNVTASSLDINGEATLGMMGVNVSISSSLIPSASGLNLGSSTNHWANLYVDNFSAGGTNLDGTSSQYFEINTSATSDETSGLRFYRSPVNGYASLVWDAATQSFELYSRESASTLADLSAGNITGGTYNGNTISAGAGTLDLGSYTLGVTGNSSLDQDLLSTSSPTFSGLTLAYDGSHKSVMTVDASGNLGIANTSGYTKFNTASTQNYLQIFDSTGLNYLQLTHNGVNAQITTNTGNVELGTAGNLTLGSGVNIVGQGDFKIEGDSSTRTITVGDTSKANGDIVAIDATNWSVGTSGMLNASNDGLGTKVVGGPISDASFTGSAFNGLMALDSTDGRLYFRYGGAWHYVNQTGGFQIPNYEVAPKDQLSEAGKEAAKNALPFEATNYPDYLTKPLTAGEFLIPYVNSYLPDGAIHGLYANWDDVKKLMLADTESEIATLKAQSDSQSTLLASIQSQIDELKSQTNQGLNATQIGTNTADISELKVIFGLDQGNPVGDVSITGKLTAETTETGALIIKISDNSNPTIGTATITPANSSTSTSTDTSASTTSDIISDSGSDGKSVIVTTTAVTDSCKVFTNFENNPGGYSWIEKLKNAKGNYTGFKINLSQPVTKDTKVDWWIVDQN